MAAPFFSVKGIVVDKELMFSIVAMAIYVVGGISTFTGIVFIFLLKGKDLWGWGTADTMGYLLVCVGLVLSILGVLVMRILRNRI